MNFEKNVFINCPFDVTYVPLLRPLLFTIIYLGLKPRIALESMDAGQARLDKIVTLIRESKFGIHDLSRSEAVKAGEMFRLNMPFELGIDFGCRLFGRGPQKQKKILVLEATPHRYKAALSDLSGSDVECHENQPYKMISIARNWLKITCGVETVGASKIDGAFFDFMAWNFDELVNKGFSSQDIEALPIPELMGFMERWVADNR